MSFHFSGHYLKENLKITNDVPLKDKNPLYVEIGSTKTTLKVNTRSFLLSQKTPAGRNFPHDFWCCFL